LETVQDRHLVVMGN